MKKPRLGHSSGMVRSWVTVYFGGLWLTVRHLAIGKHQAILTAGSFIIRNALAAMGFYPVIKQGWEYALICLAGLLLARSKQISRIKAPTC